MRAFLRLVLLAGLVAAVVAFLRRLIAEHESYCCGCPGECDCGGREAGTGGCCRDDDAATNGYNPGCGCSCGD